MRVPALLAMLIATPAFAEHASEDACAKDAACFARTLATTLTDAPAQHAPDIRERTQAPAEQPTLELRRFVDFAPGRVRVYSNGRAKVEAFAERWKRHPDWAQITVHGFAGAHDADLARRRAEKIRGYLIRYGVPAELVVAVGNATSSAATTNLSVNVCEDRCAQRAP